MTHNNDPFRHNQLELAQPVNIQEALDVDHIDAYRNQQAIDLGMYLVDGGYTRHGINQGKSLYLANEVPKVKAEKLAAFGINPLSTEYNTYDRLLSSATIDPFDPAGDSWRRPDNDGITKRDRYEKEWESTFGIRSDIDPVPSDINDGIDNEPTPIRSLDDLQSDIELKREEVSSTFAKRMKIGVFNRKKKRALQEQLDEQKNSLADITKERNDRLVEKLRAEGLNEDQIIEKIAEQANAEAFNSDKSQRDAMIGGRLYQRAWNGLNEKYANLPRSAKIGAGVLMGMSIGVGAGLATSVAAPAAAVFVGARIYRTYAMNKAKLYETPDDPKPIELTDGDRKKTLDEIITESSSYTTNRINERIEKGDKIKKKAVIVSLGSAAIVGFGLIAENSDTIAAAGRAVGEKVSGGFGSAKESVVGWFNRDDIASDGPIRSTPQPSESMPVMPEPENSPLNEAQGITPETPGITPETPAEATPTPQPEVTAPAPEIQLPPAGGDGGSIDGFNIDQYTDAMNVAHGEGWYSTFGELGITSQADQAKLLNNDVLMAKLSNMNLAYIDNKIGGWGIRMPSDGKMPADALKLIRETAQQSNLTLSR